MNGSSQGERTEKENREKDDLGALDQFCEEGTIRADVRRDQLKAWLGDDDGISIPAATTDIEWCLLNVLQICPRHNRLKGFWEADGWLGRVDLLHDRWIGTVGRKESIRLSLFAFRCETVNRMIR